MPRWRRLMLSLALSSGCGPTPTPAHKPQAPTKLTAGPTTKFATLEAELLASHEAALHFHRQGDWRGIAAAASDPSMNVSRGRVDPITRAAAETRFQGYFAAAIFTRYEDLEAPIPRVSEDGSLGWVIAKVRVEGHYRHDDGAREPLDTTWGWVELYERENDAWRRVGMVSNHDEGPLGLAGPLGAHEEAALKTLAAAQLALGGRQALAAIHTIDTSATVTAPRGALVTRVIAASDGRVRFEQDSSTGTRVITALAEGVWVGAPDKLAPGDANDRNFALGHALHLALMSPTRLYTGAKDRGEARFMDRSARVIEFTDPLGNPLRIYYATDTDLPLGLEVVEPESSPPEPIFVEVSDWRPHGTTRAFHHAVFKHRGDEYIYDYGEIRFNDTDAEQLRAPTSSELGEDPGRTSG